MINNVLTMLLELIEKKKLTATYLSQRLDVSTRTIYRYVDELSLANIPISTVKGKNGGIFIGEEYKINSVLLSNKELNIIKSALQIYTKEDIVTNINTINDIITKFNYLSTINKDINSNNKIIEYTTKREKIILDKLNIFEYSLVNHMQTRIDYHDRTSTTTTRVIYPYQLLINEKNWYIYAYCSLRKDFRAFKLSRITNINLLDKTFSPLANNSPTWKFDFKESEKSINLILRLNDVSRYDIEEWLGIEAVSVTSNKELLATTTQILDNDLLYKLLSFGDNVEILSPNNVKSQLLELTASITKLYAKND